MSVSFLTPLGALLAVLVLAPLAVFLLRERRARRIRRLLGLGGPGLRARLPVVLSLAAVPGLLGLAAAQPILEADRMRLERTDAEVFVALDISRSMLAAAGPDAPTRFERARELTLSLSAALGDVPLGLASLTDRMLPHVFPTTDRRVVTSALLETMGVDRPPGSFSFTTVPATSFDALASVPELSYFSPGARKRLLVVLTDGETRALERDLSGPFSRGPRIDTVFVRFWGQSERIYDLGGVPEDAYQPFDAQGAALGAVAEQIGAQVFAEREGAAVLAAAREALGTGPTRERVIQGERRALMPWVVLAAFLPLGVVLRRRNL